MAFQAKYNNIHSGDKELSLQDMDTLELSNQPILKQDNAKEGTLEKKPTNQTKIAILAGLCLILLVTVIVLIIIYLKQEKLNKELSHNYSEVLKEMNWIQNEVGKIRNDTKHATIDELRSNNSEVSQKLLQEICSAYVTDINQDRISKDLNDNYTTVLKKMNWIKDEVCEAPSIDKKSKSDAEKYAADVKKMQQLRKEVCSSYEPECTVDLVMLKTWIKFQNSFYFFSDSSKSWKDSRNICQQKGADLVVIKSREEQNFLAKKCHNNCWIGLSDEEEENKWIWVDGTNHNIGDGYWCKGEPNDFVNFGVKGEDCAAISYQYGCSSEWNDIPCNMLFPFVCEKVNMCSSL
ncbi:asialoglycoprotein receptor 1-like [Protopterus annectens]|uniref:asialoglycoprotein receptor 1-like n=1 Tax=Protopterus annectens TaxID=7888 RepID=UPI001CF94A54|nr:asialoglycoprotein receptor 1-like [Protopterus annectens]